MIENIDAEATNPDYRDVPFAFAKKMVYL